MAYCLDGRLDRSLVFHGAENTVVEDSGRQEAQSSKSRHSLDSDSDYRLKV